VIVGGKCSIESTVNDTSSIYIVIDWRKRNRLANYTVTKRPFPLSMPNRQHKLEKKTHIDVDTNVIEINGLSYLQHQARKPGKPFPRQIQTLVHKLKPEMLSPRIIFLPQVHVFG
jgi:hypothetical protein